MTETEAKRATEILRPYFPVAEAVRYTDLAGGYHGWCVRTYGQPEFISTPQYVGAFIVGKITDYTPADAKADAAIDADIARQEVKQAEKENAFGPDPRD